MFKRYIEWTYRHPRLMKNFNLFNLIIASLMVIYLVWTDQFKLFGVWFWVWIESFVFWFIACVDYRDNGD